MGATKGPRRTAGGAARLRLDMTIRNFGPIKRAAISLRPLTMFVGANNTGKSYAATLAHSLISARRRLGMPRYAPASPGGGARRPAAALAALEDALSGFGPEEEAPCPPAVASGIVRSSMGRYRALLQGEVERNFGSDLQSLARSGTGHFSLSVKAGDGATAAYGKSGMSLRPAPKLAVVLKRSRLVGAPGFRLEERGDAPHCAVAAAPRQGIRGLAPLVYAGLESAVLRRALGPAPARFDYLPAARSGVLQSYRAIASGIVRSASHAGVGGARIPRTTGVIADYTSSIIDMGESRGAHYDAGTRIEGDVLGGHVGVQYSGPAQCRN